MSGFDHSQGVRPRGAVRSSDNLFLGPTWPETKLGAWALQGFGSLVVGAVRGAEAIRSVGVELGAAPVAAERDAISRWLDQRVWPARPLRIALGTDHEFCTRLVAAHGVYLPEWLADWERHHAHEAVVDAHVHVRANGAVDVTTFENSGLDAAWFDWSQERPLCFPSVFPARVDCAQVTVEPDALGAVDPLLARLLCEAAALLSRHPSRVTLEDRLRGRNAGWAMAQPDPDFNTDPLTILMRELTDTLHACEATVRRSPAARCAARLLGAWAASCDGVEEGLVRSAAEVAWDVNRDEAETALRVGAVRLSQSDDPAGLEALEHAAEALRGRDAALHADQLEYISAELRTQSSTTNGIGRAAAGVVLVGATMPSEHLRHFKDDLMEDLRISGALADQDQHTYVLLQTFRMLERRAGVLYVPAEPGIATPEHARADVPSPFALSFAGLDESRTKRSTRSGRTRRAKSPTRSTRTARKASRPKTRSSMRFTKRSAKSRSSKPRRRAA